MTRTSETLLVSLLLATTACDPKDPGIEAVTEPTGFAVAHSDYTVASIALLGPDGSLVKDRFVHSGTTFDGLGAALASDLALPNSSEPGNVLTYIERFGADTITRIDIEEGEVLGQLKTHSGTEYKSNPYDYYYVDADTAWVTRRAPNLEDDAKDNNLGNDLLKINPGAPERTSTTISFDKFNSKGMVENMDTGEEMEVTIYANPGRMAMAGDRLIVGMDRLSLGFDAIAAGMVGVVDLADESVTGLELDGLSNCGSVVPVQGDSTRVVVSCQGFYRGVPRDEAGLVLLHNTGSEVEIEEIWKTKNHEDATLSVGGVASLGGTRVVAVAAADFVDTFTDSAFIVDIATGEQTLLAESTGSYTLGSGYLVAAQNLFLLPDAATNDDGELTGGVRRFVLEQDEDPKELSMMETDSDLPPRMIRPLF